MIPLKITEMFLDIKMKEEGFGRNISTALTRNLPEMIFEC